MKKHFLDAGKGGFYDMVIRKSSAENTFLVIMKLKLSRESCQSYSIIVKTATQATTPPLLSNKQNKLNM